MARTPEQVQADIDRLTARMVSGISLSSAGDMTTRWDNTNDAKTLDMLRGELAALVGAPAVTRFSFTRVGMRRF